MNRMEFEELLDVSGLLSGISKLDQANEKWSSQAIAQNERYRQSIELITQEIARQRQVMISLNAKDRKLKFQEGLPEAVDSSVRALRTLQAAIERNTKLFDLNKASVDQIKGRISDLKKEYDSLDRSEAKNVQRMNEIQNEVKTTKQVLDGLVIVTQKATRVTQVAENSLNALRKRTVDLKKQLDSMPDAYDKTTGEINKQNKAAVELNKTYQANISLVKRIETGQQVFSRNVGNYPLPGQSGTSKGMELGGRVVSAATGALGGLGLAVSAAQVATDIISVGSEYEKLNLLVENSYEGNKKLARDAEAVIRDFADHSPLDVAEVTTSFIRLRDAGINPTKQTLVQLSDMAIAKNKSIKDYTEAIVDAQMGEFERLKEFGINANKSGDKVIFTFKGISTEVKYSQKAISEYLIELGKTPGIVGATDRLAESSAGKWSTLKDTFKGLAASIFGTLKPGFNALLDGLTSVTGFLGSGFGPSMAKTADSLSAQTNKVAELEAALPGLLTRYDELKSKAQLSAVEQKELQGIINRLAGLVPSAATGFDAYGNALDVNKGKVLQFTAAQRQLNAELNKQVIKDLNTQAKDSINKAKKAQDILNKGTEQSSFNFKPFFMMSAEERKQATAKNEGDRRQKAITDERRKELQQQMKEQTEVVSTAAKQVLSAGGQLDAATRKFLQGAGDFGVEQAALIEDKSRLIADKQAKAAVLFSKGLFKERDGILKEIEKLQDERNKLIGIQAVNAPTLSDKVLTGTKEKKKKDDLTELEKVEKKIREIESLLSDEALQDVRNGNVISVDPKKLEELQQLKKQLEEVRATLDLINAGRIGANGSNVTPVIGSLDQMQSVGDPFFGELDKKGRKVALGKSEEKQLKRDQGLSKNLDEQIAILNLYGTKRQELEKSFSEGLGGLRDSQKDELKALLGQQLEAERAGKNERVQMIEQEFQRKAQLYKEDADKRKELAMKAVEIGTTLVNGLFDLEQDRLSRQQTSLDKQKERELKAAGDSVEARKAIEENYDKKNTELKRRQARIAKMQAMFQIAVSTAVAVAEALPNIPLSIGIGALGAVQLALVASKNPAYKDGKNLDTLDTYAGPALVGEAGRELWITDGKAKIVDRPSVVNVGRDDVILPNRITEQVMQSGALKANIYGRNAAWQADMQLSAAGRIRHEPRGSVNQKAITEAIKQGFTDIEVHQWRVIDGQLTEVIVNGNQRRVNLSKRHRLS